MTLSDRVTRMTPDQIATAETCHSGAHDNRLTFPQILATLQAAGFEGYLVDYRLGETRYYLPDGQSHAVPSPAQDVALPFAADRIRAAIHAAQTGAAGYRYQGFSAAVAAAGCAGYLVSLPGRRVVYFGRSAEIHTEHFPD